MSKETKGPPRIWPPHAWDAQKPLREELANSGRLLYHYTSTQALVEIVRHERLWASDVRRSNDASEITYALDLLRDELELGDQPDTRLLAANAPPALFAACFSELDDDLSQWRAYCRPWGGAAIGVSLDQLLKGIRDSLPEDEKEGVGVNQVAVALKCIYDQDQHRRIIADALAELGHTRDPLMDSFLLEQFSLIKHPAFQSEREWRVVVPLFALRDKDVAQRATPTGVTQYLELPLKRTAIKRVVVGPALEPEQTLNAQGVAMLFAKESGSIWAPAPDITPSQVPYRAW